MSARERILASIRSAAAPSQTSPEAIAQEAAALLAAPHLARPALSGTSLAEAFERKARALGASIERVPGMTAIPAATGQYLQAQGLPHSIALQPTSALTELDWSDFDTHAQAAPDEAAGLGLALWGIAESGSLVVHSGAQAPILLSFLPLHHILVVQETRLLPYLEDYALCLGQADIPRNAILITGPSGTTDIEGTHVRGAHGPGFLHILMVTASDASGACSG